MKVFVCVVLLLSVTGCAARGVAPTATPRTVPSQNPASPDGVDDLSVSVAPGDSLETFMAKVRKVVERARPARTPATTMEMADPALAAALLVAEARPTPESLRAVAREYRRLRIADRALAVLNRALKLDREDAATYDELARTWRDSGLPNLAMGDAHRATYYAPASPIVRNTMGTVFQALGRREEARTQYELALTFDPSAAYALNNLCYGWLLEGDARKAASVCREALELEPELAAARNNLGMAYAASNELDAARAEFEQSGDQAAALYNLGIMHLARHEYARATTAFGAAQQARPMFRGAAARARQAQELLAAGDNK